MFNPSSIKIERHIRYKYNATQTYQLKLSLISYPIPHNPADEIQHTILHKMQMKPNSSDISYQFTSDQNYHTTQS